MSYNIWSASKTKNGFAADEVISTLQKVFVEINQKKLVKQLMNYIQQDLYS